MTELTHVPHKFSLSCHILAGHKATQKKNYISQAPLQWNVALWQNAGWWDVSRRVVWYPAGCFWKKLVGALSPLFLIYSFFHPWAWNTVMMTVATILNRENKVDTQRVYERWPGRFGGLWGLYGLELACSTLCCLPLDFHRQEKYIFLFCLNHFLESVLLTAESNPNWWQRFILKILC